MIQELIMQGNVFLNAFGSDNYVGEGLSPHNIIDNLLHVDYNDLKYKFGQYVQLHVTEKVTNTMLSRTTHHCFKPLSNPGTMQLYIS